MPSIYENTDVYPRWNRCAHGNTRSEKILDYNEEATTQATVRWDLTAAELEDEVRQIGDSGTSDVSAG